MSRHVTYMTNVLGAKYYILVYTTRRFLVRCHTFYQVSFEKAILSGIQFCNTFQHRYNEPLKLLLYM